MTTEQIKGKLVSFINGMTFDETTDVWNALDEDETKMLNLPAMVREIEQLEQTVNDAVMEGIEARGLVSVWEEKFNALKGNKK